MAKGHYTKAIAGRGKEPGCARYAVLSRSSLESKAGSISGRGDRKFDTPPDQVNGGIAAQLQEENAKLRKTVEELQGTKKALTERILKLERSLAEGSRQHSNQKGTAKMDEAMTIVFPPHLFMKTYALIRGSTKPLVLRVRAREAVDIDVMRS